MKNDPRAMFTAASKAQAAADWMHAKQLGRSPLVRGDFAVFQLDCQDKSPSLPARMPSTWRCGVPLRINPAEISPSKANEKLALFVIAPTC